MSNYSPGRGPRPADPYPALRLAALTAVIVGVIVLTAAAFVLSYGGIHQIVLRAGVAPELAKLYPVIFDAMLVVAGAAVLALRGAGGWARAYAWSSLLLMLVVLAAGDALHTTNVALPAQPTRAALAVIPWLLLLLAFGLWLVILQHLRRVRAAGTQQGRGPGQEGGAGNADAAGQGANGVTGNGNPGPGQRTEVTWASAGGAGEGRPLPPPLAGLDALLGPREAPTPAMSGATHDVGTATAGYPGRPDAGHYPDAVSYGQETGYVHPDSYLGPSVALLDSTVMAGPAVTRPVATTPGEALATTAEAPLANAGPFPAAAEASPAAPGTLPDGAAADGAAADGAAADGAAADGSAAAVTAAAAKALPDAEAAPTPSEGSQPTAENSSEATAQSSPAGEDPRSEGGDTTREMAAPDPGPPLERLRSTPAPPNE